MKLVAGIAGLIVADLQSWCKELARNADEKGWDSSLPYVIGHIHSEAAEVFKEHLRGMKSDYMYTENGKPEGIPVEMADILLVVLTWFGRNGLDPEKFMLAKHEYNKTRPYRHGLPTIGNEPSQ